MPKGGVTILSNVQQAYIRENRMKISGSDMAATLGVGKYVVTRFLRTQGLQVPRELVHKWKGEKLMGRTTSDAKTDTFLKRNYLKTPINQLAVKLERSKSFIKTRLRQLGLTIPPEIIKQRKNDSRIKPGNVPPNKGVPMTKERYQKAMATIFKNGHIPHNAYGKDLVITIRNDKRGVPHKHIRVALGKWIPYHHYRWEMFRGKIPHGHCICFKDGNSLNTKLSNLECITRKENMRRNSISRFTPEVRSAIFSLSKLNKNLKLCETKLETSLTTSSYKSKGSTKKNSQAKTSKTK